MEHQDTTPIDIGNPSLRKKTTPHNAYHTTAENARARRLDNATDPQKIACLSKNLAQQISTARNAKKLTQKQMAAQLGVSLPIYSSIEAGRAQSTPQNNKLVQKIQKICGVTFTK